MSRTLRRRRGEGSGDVHFVAIQRLEYRASLSQVNHGMNCEQVNNLTHLESYMNVYVLTAHALFSVTNEEVQSMDLSENTIK